MQSWKFHPLITMHEKILLLAFAYIDFFAPSVEGYFVIKKTYRILGPRRKKQFNMKIPCNGRTLEKKEKGKGGRIRYIRSRFSVTKR